MSLDAKQYMEKFGLELNESSTEIDSWMYYHTYEVPTHTKDRIVVFKTPQSCPQIGCIRVRDKNNVKKTVWEVVGREGAYIGLVPAGCPFEAMLVDVKLITPK